MVNTQTRHRPFYTPKPDPHLCMCVDLQLDKKLWKIRIGPPGRRAVAGRWAVVGRWAIVGRWAAGGWDAGLFLANPMKSASMFNTLFDYQHFINELNTVILVSVFQTT